MRQRVPAIASVSSSDSKICQLTEDEAALAAWEQETFIVHKPGTTADDVFSTMKLLPTIALHFLPAASAQSEARHQLCLQAEHHLIDGRGVFLLFDRFWSILTDNDDLALIAANSVSNLPLEMEDLLGLPVPSTVENGYIAESWMAEMGKISAPLGVPIAAARRAATPTTSRRGTTTLSLQTTSQVLSACRQHGFTVTAAWLAAVATALAEIQPQPVQIGAGLATFSTVDMRKYFPEEFVGRASPVACYHTAVPTVLPLFSSSHGTARRLSFIEVAKNAHTLYHGSGDSDEGIITSQRQTAWAPYTDLMAQAIEAAGNVLNPTHGAPLISSYGIVDKFIHRLYPVPEGEAVIKSNPMVEILDVWLSDTMASPTSFWSMHTWDGRINMSLAYNLAFYDPKDIQALLEAVGRNLRNGLGIRG
jgi:hypothetical protein